MPEVLKYVNDKHIVLNFADMKRYDSAAKLDYLY